MFKSLWRFTNKIVQTIFRGIGFIVSLFVFFILAGLLLTLILEFIIALLS